MFSERFGKSIVITGHARELVILDAVKAGFMPFQGGDRKAA